jgi:hypothetical protein
MVARKAKVGMESAPFACPSDAAQLHRALRTETRAHDEPWSSHLPRYTPSLVHTPASPRVSYRSSGVIGIFVEQVLRQC